MRLGAWLALGLFQLVVEPAATLAYIRLEWLNGAFAFRNISPLPSTPALWVATVVVLVVLALRYAPTRYGWPFAVALSVFAYPRLLVYQLLTLLAAFGGPRNEATDPGVADRPGRPIARLGAMADGTRTTDRRLRADSLGPWVVTGLVVWLGVAWIGWMLWQNTRRRPASTSRSCSRARGACSRARPRTTPRCSPGPRPTPSSCSTHTPRRSPRR